MLSQPLSHELQARFGCPVLDVYSMNKAGPMVDTFRGEDNALRYTSDLDLPH